MRKRVGGGHATSSQEESREALFREIVYVTVVVVDVEVVVGCAAASDTQSHALPLYTQSDSSAASLST